MRRREVIAGLAGATAGWPRAVSAQQPAMPVVGFLSSESRALFASFLGAFTHGLNEAGFVEGQNVAIEYRWAQGQNQRLPILAADLVHRQVSVIAAPGSTPAALAAQRASATIPIVIFTGGDPVALGLVTSLNRPGGNVTGATSLGRELAAKRLGLLHELMPTATIMALLVNPTNTALTETTTSDVQAAARTLGLQLHILHAGTERDFDTVFATLVQLRASALVIAIDSFFTVRREKLAALALRHRVPAVYQYRDFAAAGGVMSYGGSLVEGYDLVGLYTGRILRGEKPADLPVQQVTKVELVINLIAANELNLTIPPSLLARADEVIE
jgi:putative tryptophan/tyrosine transport system substrate-binding protein